MLFTNGPVNVSLGLLLFKAPLASSSGNWRLLAATSEICYGEGGGLLANGDDLGL